MESVVDFALYCTCTVRVCPAASVAGSLAELTEKELSELLNSVIRNSVLPEFVTETFLEAAVPTATSPKSTEAGLTSGAAVDENAFESEPQPVSPAVKSAMAAIAGIATSLASKTEKKRNLIIRRHLSQSGQPMQKEPREHCRGKIVYACVGLTDCRIDPAELWVQVTMVTIVVCTEYLCTADANCCTTGGWTTVIPQRL